MSVIDGCNQYFNAASHLENWKNNGKITNSWLIIEVASYFTIIAPLIVLSAYAVANLVGRVSKKPEKANLDQVTNHIYTNTVSRQIPSLSLENFRLKSLSEQQEIIENFQLQSLLDKFGSLQAFNEKLNSANSNILKLIYIDKNSKDMLAIEYALLTNEEVMNLTMSQLQSITRYQALVLKARLDQLPQSDQNGLANSPLPENVLNLNLNKLSSSAISNEQIQFLIDNLGEAVINLLSDNQLESFIAQLDINLLKTGLYDEIFYYSKKGINKKRFSFLSNEQVSAIMQKFNGSPRGLFSESQNKYYFGNLKADQVDEGLYNKLFYVDDAKTNKQRFQLIPNEEVPAFMSKFRAAPRTLLSESQNAYYFSNLKADQVDQSLYDRLFYVDDTNMNKQRFQLIPNEEATVFMSKFKTTPKKLLSESQNVYYFSNLKADQVDRSLYNRLFYVDDANINKQRFQLLPNEEAAALMNKFRAAPKELLSESQSAYFESK